MTARQWKPGVALDHLTGTISGIDGKDCWC